MITNVYFVRHAQPDISIRDDLTRPLTKKGLEDTKKVTKALIDKNISSVYSSPYKRAADTVRDFVDTVKLDIIMDDNFCERRVGEWVEDYKSYSQKQWEDFDFKLQDGESLREVQKRNINMLLQVIKDNMGKNIVIGTHGTALSTIINYFKPSFGHADFWGIIDKMPYILCFRFNGLDLEYIEEIKI